MTVDSPQKAAFFERVQETLETKGVSQSWLAEQIGITRQGLGNLLRTGKKPKHIEEIATALDVNINWLLTGKGFRDKASNDTPTIKVPIFNKEILLSHKRHTTDCLYLEEYSAPSEGLFGYHLDNRSMTPLFEEGCLLIFDENRKPHNGSYVLAQIKDSQDIYFRKYESDASDVYLKALNEDYKTLYNPSVNLLGVLVQSRMMF